MLKKKLKKKRRKKSKKPTIQILVKESDLSTKAINVNPNRWIINELKGKIHMSKNMIKKAFLTCKGRSINQCSSFKEQNVLSNDEVHIKSKLLGGMKEHKKYHLRWSGTSGMTIINLLQIIPLQQVGGITNTSDATI